MKKNNLYIVSFAYLLMIGLISAQDHFWAFNEGKGRIAYDSGNAYGWGKDGDRNGGNYGDKDGGYGGRDRDRDGGYGGRDGDRDGGYGGRDDDRDGRYGGRDGDRDGGYGGRDGDRNGGYGGRNGDRDGGNYGGRDGDRDGGYGDKDGDRYGGRDGDYNRGRYRGAVNAYLNNAFWRKISGGSAVGITGADNSFVTFGNQVARFGTQDFTVAFWVQTREKLELFDLIGNRDTSDYGNYFNVRMDRDGSVTAEICEDARGTNYMGIRAVQKGLNDGDWHHIAVVRSKGTLSLYIDGDFSIYGSNHVATNINNRNPLKLGRSLVDRSTRRFSPKALFDDVAIYYRALSYIQVKKLYDDTNE